METDLRDRTECELCCTVFNIADIAARAAVDDEIRTACLGCLTRILLGERTGRIVYP